MKSFVMVATILALATGAFAQQTSQTDPQKSDPPKSDQKSDKPLPSIAGKWLVAFETQQGTMNATLEAGRCDVMIGAPAGYDLVRTTTPYYRSTYVFVYRKDKGFQLRTLDDPILKTIKIGVHLLGEDYSNPPPVHELAKRGVVANVVGFDTFYSEKNPPSAIIDAVASGKIDAAIVWGPAAGYFVLHQKVPMAIVPIPSGKTDLPFAFDISMGVKRGDDALFDRVQQALTRRQAAITAILKEYGVPLERKADAK